MKSWRTVLLVFLAALSATTVQAIPVEWEGISWDLLTGTALPQTDGSLILSGPYIGQLHYETLADFRAVDTPWVEVVFYDPGPGGAGLRLQLEDNSHDSTQSLTQFGSWGGFNNYYVYWWDIPTAQEGYYNIGVRTPGEHTLQIGLAEDGAVEYYLDGLLVVRMTDIDPDAFTDIILDFYNINPFGSITLTEFQMGNNDPQPTPIPQPTPNLGPVPEPTTLCLAGIGIGILAVCRKRRL